MAGRALTGFVLQTQYQKIKIDSTMKKNDVSNDVVSKKQQANFIQNYNAAFLLFFKIP